MGAVPLVKHYDYYEIVKKALNIRVVVNGTQCTASVYDGGHQVCKISITGSKEECRYSAFEWIKENYKVVKD